MTFLALAAASMRNRPARTVVCVCGVALAVAMLTVYISVSSYVALMNANVQPRCVVVTSGAAYNMPASYVDVIAAMPAVKATGRRVEYYRNLHAWQGKHFFFVHAISDGWIATQSPASQSWPPQVYAAWRADERAVVVDARLARELGWKVGQDVRVDTREMGIVEGHLVGIGDGTGEAPVFHYAYIERLATGMPESSHQGRLRRIAVPCTTSDDCARLADAIDERFQDERDATLSMESGDFFQTQTDRDSAGARLIVRGSLLLVLVTLSSTLFVLVSAMRERRAQLAALRAIGFSRLRVAVLMLLEALTLCWTGGLIGALVPWLVFRTSGLHLGDDLLDQIPVPLRASGLALLATVAFALVVGGLPALLSTRLSVRELLED